MEQEQIIEQILGRLEEAGFQRSEIEHQVSTQLATGIEPVLLRCIRDFEGTALLLEAELTREPAEIVYELTALRISEHLVPDREQSALKLNAADGDYLNVPFAAYMFTGRFDRLMLELSALGLSANGGPTPAALVRRYLKALPDQVEATGFCQDVSGATDYTIRIVTQPEGYCVQDYEMSFAPYPVLRHGEYCGVNTLELENDMAAIDWSRDHAIFFQGDSEPVFFKKVQSVLDRLEQLRASIPGGYAGHILQLKYLQQASVAEVLIDDKAWDTLKRLPATRAVFPPEIPIRSAQNLMAGRAVLQTEGKVLHDADTWLKIGQTTDGSPAVFTSVQGYSWEALRQHASLIPAWEIEVGQMAQRLSRGDMVRIRTIQGGILYAQADPEQRQLMLTTADRHPIPFNFQLDPEWRPPPLPHLETKHYPGRKKARRGHRKGKGLK